MKNRNYLDGPPERELAKKGKAKELFERVYSRKDKVVERTSQGKAIMGYRKIFEFTGNPKTLDDELRTLEDEAIAIYHNPQAEIFLVNVDNDLCIAEAFDKSGKSIWNAVEEASHFLLNAVYTTFPKQADKQYIPPSKPEEMSVRALEELLEQKKAASTPDKKLAIA